MFFDMLLLSWVECGMERKLLYYIIITDIHVIFKSEQFFLIQLDTVNHVCALTMEHLVCIFNVKLLFFSTKIENAWLFIARVLMFDNLPDLCFKLLVIIPKYSKIAESTCTRVIPLMMLFLVLKCVSTYTRGRLIHENIRKMLNCHSTVNTN